MPPHHDFDWKSLVDPHGPDPPAADPRRRLRWILGFYAAALSLVLVRAVQLELSDGENFRRLAARPAETAVTVTAPRGRILARDGTVLASDREIRSLAVHFRYLQSPPEPRWLRKAALARLTRAERRRPERVAAAEQAVRDELADLHARLARLCHLDDAQWRKRAGRIERRVTTIAQRVNRQQRKRFGEQSSQGAADEPLGALAILAGLFAPPEPLPPPEVVVAEQLAYHAIVDDLADDVCAAIEDHPAAFSGVKIVAASRRRYPLESLAANIVGHVGSPAEDRAHDEFAEPPDTAAVGLLGIERSLENRLHGQPGLERHLTNRAGRVLSIETRRPAVPGGDAILTLDPALQHFAEQLLDRLAQRTDEPGARPVPGGGAIVVIDVHSGDVLTAASEPRFDPNAFAAGDPQIESVLADPRRPLFDRAAKMALPPGSVFKPLVALALVEQGIVDPQAVFHCQGYLDSPDSMRCQVFRRQGIGHGDLTLADALAQSCNVYFFHHATRLGAPPLVDWAGRFGLGQRAAIDLPDQATGHLPAATELRADRRLQAFAIGQETLTATPLQIARCYATIANGGYLVEARFTRDRLASPPTADDSLPQHEMPSTARRLAIDPRTLSAVQAGLRRVVEDPLGTAHESLHMADFPIAGKTGTAETEAGNDHAWFAGYAPADNPRWAFVVALEHGGGGASAAAIARSLVERMRQLGYFPTAKAATAQHQFPPGKG
jgi:penicillin-binding protein 2